MIHEFTQKMSVAPSPGSSKSLGAPGAPLPSILATEFGTPFVLGYVVSYMLVTMGCLGAVMFYYVLHPRLWGAHRWLFFVEAVSWGYEFLA